MHHDSTFLKLREKEPIAFSLTKKVPITIFLEICYGFR